MTKITKKAKTSACTLLIDKFIRRKKGTETETIEIMPFRYLSISTYRYVKFISFILLVFFCFV